MREKNLGIVLLWIPNNNTTINSIRVCLKRLMATPNEEAAGPSGVGRNQVDNEEERSGDVRYILQVTDDSSEEGVQEEQQQGEEQGRRRSDGGGRYFIRRLVREVVESQSAESSTLNSILSMIAGSLGGAAIAASSRQQSAEMETSSESSGASSDLESLFWPTRKKSKGKEAKPKPTNEQIEKLKTDDFCQLTERSLGKPMVQRTLPQLIAQREIGCCSAISRNFSSGQKCQITDRFLPNKRQVLLKYRQKAFCGSYSDDGDLFLSACQDQHLRVYDTTCGNFKMINAIRARNVGWSILDTVLSPDKRHLIYSSWCDSIHQVEVFSDKEDNNHQALQLTAGDDSRFCVFSLRFSQDGDEILCGSNDGCLYLYDRIYMRQSMKISAHEDDVNAVAFVDTPTHVVASGGDDGLCKIWDRRALRENHPVPVGILAGHLDGLTYIDPRGDGRYLITNSKDQSIKLWDLRKFSSTRAVEETKRAVCNQNWDYRWQNVPRHLHRLPKEISEDSSVMTYRGHSILQTLIRCHFSPAHTTAQKFIYTGCASGSVVVYDALTGEIVRELSGHRSCVRDVSWHPFQPEIISSSWDFTLARWTYCEDLSDVSKTSKTRASLSTSSDADAAKRRRCLRSKTSTEESL